MPYVPLPMPSAPFSFIKIKVYMVYDKMSATKLFYIGIIGNF